MLNRSYNNNFYKSCIHLPEYNWTYIIIYNLVNDTQIKNCKIIIVKCFNLDKFKIGFFK